MSELEDLLAGLRAEGTVDSVGGFSLDREKAREKMRHFQLADPLEYLLQLVRAAVHQGATAIDVRIDTNDMWFAFDGAVFSVDDFDELYGALFGRADDPSLAARRHLALGLNAALALDPAQIRVESGEAQLVARPGVDDDFGPLTPARSGTWIHVRDRFRFSHFVRFFRTLGEVLPEQAVLRARARYSPIPITLNAARIDEGEARLASGCATWLTLDDGPATVAGGHLPVQVPGRVEVVVAGVTICVLPLPVADGFRAVVRDPRLQTDVSQSDVVRDPVFEALMALLERARHASLLAMIAQSVTADELLALELAAAPPLSDWDPHYPPQLRERLRGLKRWPTVAGEMAGIGDLPARPEYVRVDPKPQLAALDLSPAAEWRGVPVLDDVALADFRRIFPDAVDQTDRLLAQIETLENKAAWAERWIGTRLQGSGWLARELVARGPIHGEVGVHPDLANRAVLRLAIDGRLLTERRIVSPALGLEAILHGPFTPTKPFDDVEDNAIFAQAMQAFASVVPALVRSLARTGPRHLDAFFQRWLARAAAGDPWTHGRSEGEDTDPPEWFGALADPEVDDPIADLPWLDTAAGAPATLRDVAGWVRAGQPLRWVGRGRPPLVTDPPLLRLEVPERGLLSAIFHVPIESGAQAYADAAARAEHLDRPRTPASVEFDDTVHAQRVPLDHDGFVGEVALRAHAGRRQKEGAWPLPVELRIDGRAIEVIELRSPLPGLVASVEHPDFRADPSWGAVRDLDRPRLLAAIASRISTLIVGGEDPGGARRRMVRGLVALVCPSAAHRWAWETLRAAHAPAAAERAYLAILRCGWASDPEAVAEALEAQRAQDQPPAADAPPSGAAAARMIEAVLGPAVLVEHLDEAPIWRLMARFPGLAEARVIRTLGRRGVSLAQVRDASTRSPVLFGPRPKSRPDGYGGLMLKADLAMIEMLEHALGPDRLQRASEWSRAHAEQQAWDACPEIGAAPDPAEVMLIQPIEHGAVGLPRAPARTARVRVIRDGRLAVELTTKALFPVVVHLDDPAIAIRFTARGLALASGQKARLDQQVAAAAADLVPRLAADFDALPHAERTGAWVHVLNALARLARGRARRPGNLERDVHTRVLSGITGFVTLGGHTRSLLDLSRHRAAGRPLWITGESAEPPADPDAWVVRVARWERTALKQLFGVHLEDYQAVRAEADREAAFMAGPERPLALAGAAVEVPVRYRGIQGLLGLEPGRSRLRIHRAGRPLGEVDLGLGLPDLVAVIEDPEAEPNDDWSGVAHGPRLGRARVAIARAVPALLAAAGPQATAIAEAVVRSVFPSGAWAELFEAAVAKLGGDPGRTRYFDALRALLQGATSGLRRHAAGLGEPTSRLARAEGGPRNGQGDAIVRALFGGRWPLTGDHPSPVHALLSAMPELGPVPWIPTTDGPPLTLEALRDLPTVVHAPRPGAHHPSGTLRLDADTLAIVRALRPEGLIDADAADLDRRRRARLRERAPMPSMAPPTDQVVLTTAISAPDFEGELGLRFPCPPGGRAAVTVCLGGRPVGTLTDLRAGLIGAVEAPGAELQWHDATIVGLARPEALAAKINAVVPQVLADLVARFDTLDPARQAAALQHARARLPHDLEVLGALPLVGTTQGAISIERAKALLEKGALVGAPPGAALPKGVRALTTDGCPPAVGACLGRVPTWTPPAAPPPETPPESTPPPPQPATPAHLDTRVRAILRALRADGDRLLSDAQIDQIVVEPGDGATAIGRTESGVRLDRRHPSVAAALDAHDPILDAFVASAALSGLNAWSPVFDDAGEARLQRRLLRWLVR